MAEDGKGTLYLVGTPIGNLDDMTFRAVKTLKAADLIAAEDTRHTRKLLAHFDIHVPLTSYHEHNKLLKGPGLVNKLLHGENIAVVSDAGLPGIADPGSHLAYLAIQENIEVSPVPGANAALSALISSGLNTIRFSFVGFLPKKAARRREILDEVKCREDTLIFYETPHRLKVILKEIMAAFGGKRKAALGRELTKKFEQFIRGTLEEVNDYFSKTEPRGEFVLIIEGYNKAADENHDKINVQPVEYVKNLVDKGMMEKEAIKKAAKDLNVNRRELYNTVVKMHSSSNFQ